MLVQAAIGAVVPVLPAFASSLGLTATGVGVVVSTPSLAKVVLNLPAGRLVDSRWGRKGPMVLGALVDGCGSLATAAATSLSSLVPARLAVGAGSSMLATAEQAYLMDVVERFPNNTGALLGTVQAVGLLGWAVGPAVGGVLAERGGAVRLPYVVIGSVLIGSAGLYALLPETRRARGSADASPGAARPPPLRTLLADRSQRALLASRFGLIVGWAAWLTVVPLRAASVWGAGAADLGLMFSALTCVGLAAAPVGGLLADRLGSRRVALGSSALGALAVMSLPLCRSRASFWASMAVWDVAESAYTAAVSALAAEVTPASWRGSANSLLNQVQDVTFGTMPLALGLLAARVGQGAALLSAAALMLGSSLAFWRFSRGDAMEPGSEMVRESSGERRHIRATADGGSGGV